MIRKLLNNKELRLVLVAQAIQLIGALGFTKLLTMFMSKSDYGFYTLAMSLVVLISMLPFTALNEGIARYISIYESKGLVKNYLINIPILYGLIFVPYLLVGFFSYYFVDNEWRKILYPIILLTFLEILKNTIFKIENNRRNRTFVASSKIFEFSFKIGITFLFAYFLKVDLIKIFILLICIDFIIIFGNYLIRKKEYCVKYINKYNIKSLSKDLIFFSWPLIIWSVFGWLQNMSNRWMINFLLDKISVAEFSLISSIAFLPSTIITGILGAFLIPIIYQKSNNEPAYAWNTIKKIIPIQIVLFLILIIGVYLYSSNIVALLSSSKYVDASWMLPFMMFGTSVFSIAQVATYEIFAHKNTRKLLSSTIIPGISSIILGYFLIKNFQLLGAMINFIFTYVLYCSLTVWVVLKFHKRIKVKNS